MHDVMKIATALACCFAPIPASALDFMGIRLGEPPNFAECKHFSYDKPAEYMKPGYGVQPVRPCWLARPASGEDPRLGTLVIHADAEHWPKTIINLTAITVDGRIEALVAATRGEVEQEEVLAGLKKKFGAPNRLATIPMHNAFAAEYLSISAEWHLPDGRVEMEGIRGRRDAGQIMVITTSGDAIMTDIARSTEEKKPAF